MIKSEIIPLYTYALTCIEISTVASEKLGIIFLRIFECRNICELLIII